MLGSLLNVAHIVVAVLLVLIVLLQRSEGAMGALGGSNAVFTGQGVSNILSKGTTILAILFMILSLLIVRQDYKAAKTESVVETFTTQKEVVLPVEEQEPTLPAAK